MAGTRGIVIDVCGSLIDKGRHVKTRALHEYLFMRNIHVPYNLIRQNEDLYCDFVGKIFSERQKQIENYVWSVVEEKMSKAVGKKVLGAWATIVLILITLVLLGIGVVTTSSSLSELSDKVKKVTKDTSKE